ncbi:MAG TPA: cytochrome c [Burkholderiales bacterium]|nr:cytochrome c [Burkholderiales bacterium]
MDIIFSHNAKRIGADVREELPVAADAKPARFHMSTRHFRRRALALVAAGWLGGCISQPAGTDEAPKTLSFEPAAVERGAQLAAIGNCIVCHTAPGGQPYAGGRALKTPFGIIHGTNITPDPETGIGRWSEGAFARAMRQGVDRDGRHLYPAFPYDHYTKLTDEDVRALYAFVMTREPVSAGRPANQLSFPFNIRSLIGLWKRLYFEPGAFVPDSGQNAEWNRGAYLVQGLGHCGACHTPRNVLGAEKNDLYLAGGEAEGWHAPALTGASPAPEPWTTDYLFRYLRGGLTDRHDAPAGPMASVVHNLAAVPEQDVRAIAVYVAAQMDPPTPERRSLRAEAGAPTRTEGGDSTLQAGATIYAGACGACHDNGRIAPYSGDALQLTYSTSVNLPTPSNFIHIVLDGVMPRDGEPGPWMPGFRGALTDGQLAALTLYARSRFGSGPPWRDVEGEVRKARTSGATGGG